MARTRGAARVAALDAGKGFVRPCVSVCVGAKAEGDGRERKQGSAVAEDDVSRCSPVPEPAVTLPRTPRERQRLEREKESESERSWGRKRQGQRARGKQRQPRHPLRTTQWPPSPPQRPRPLHSDGIHSTVLSSASASDTCSCGTRAGPRAGENREKQRSDQAVLF